jgi:hypothetical protein
MRAFVRARYASHSGFPSQRFSSIGIPETFVRRNVIRSGEAMVRYQSSGMTESEMSQIPHHILASPK